MSNDLILAIETSCDETAVCILRCKNGILDILSNEISSQIKLHAKWGGVVPNLAAREHVKNLPILFKRALEESNTTIKDITALAVTNGPGLIPALLVGVNFAKTISYLHDKPLLGIHHIEGHIYANFIENSHGVRFPILCLVVSGGHTQLVLMKDHFDYKIIGQTVDDAVGEAFDKVARILNIGYPGGPKVAHWATKFQNSRNNDQAKSKKQKAKNNVPEKLMPEKLVFPRPMMHKQGFNFSFSGLKTAVLYETKKHPELISDKNYIAEVCYEFQQAAIDVLIAKTLKAAEQYKPKTIMLAGGVSANKDLREQLGVAIKKNLQAVSYELPVISLTGDNAAMIASAAAIRWQKMNKDQKKKAISTWKNLSTDANLKLK